MYLSFKFYRCWHANVHANFAADLFVRLSARDKRRDLEDGASNDIKSIGGGAFSSGDLSSGERNGLSKQDMRS